MSNIKISLGKRDVMRFRQGIIQKKSMLNPNGNSSESLPIKVSQVRAPSTETSSIR